MRSILARSGALVAVLVLAPVASAPAATLLVDSTGSADDANPGNGVCRTAGGVCTLRAAVHEANARAGSDLIQLPAGSYTLAAGLVTTDRVSIAGAAAATTVIDGDGQTVLRVQANTTTLTRLTLTGGDAQGGGGLRVDAGASAVVSRSAIDDNDAFTGGAGVYVADGGTATIRTTSITANVAVGAFGGGVWNQGTLDLEDSTVSGNDSNRAGGIRNDGELRLRNVTVSGNTAHSSDAGVGGISQNGFAFLNNVTVTGNTGVGDNAGSFRGGGIQTSAGELTVLKNSVIAGNDGGLGPDDCVGPLTADSRYDLIGSTTACGVPGGTATLLLGVDPQLGPLADNGGPTRTHLPASTSPLVDAGFPYQPGGPAADACEARDQRAILRLACDIGAVEREVVVPASIVVDSTADVPDATPGNGVCRTPAGDCTLRAAVQEANRIPGTQEIVLPAGTYDLDEPPAEGGVDKDRGGDLDVLQDLVVTGAGRATTRIDGGDISRLFDLQPGTRLDLSGVTLRDGRDAGGGAIRITSAEAVLDHVTLSSNVSTGGGGGAIAMGGLDERLEIADSTLSGNRSDGFGSGGAIAASGAAVIRSSLIENNTSTSAGGGIDSTVGTLQLDGSTVRGNHATGGLANGGGVSATQATITASTLSGNTSAAHGGGAYVANGTLENTTVSGNSSDDRGGGVSTSGTLALRHVTLAGNQASAGGRDLLRFGSTSSLSLADVIVGSSGGGGCAGLLPTSVGGNVARDATCALTGAGDRQGVDPKLGALTGNGGTTQTRLLLAGSPALDDGRLASPASDQRGAARPQGAAPDSGAVEGTASFAGAAPQALVVGLDGAASGVDATTLAALRGLGLDARGIAPSATATVGLAGVRLVVIAGTVDAATIATRLARAHVAIATAQPAVARRLGLVRAGGTSAYATARRVRLTTKGRDVLGLAGRVGLTVANGTLVRIDPVASGRVLARIDSAAAPATLVAYPPGAPLADGTRAAARRLVLPLDPGDVQTGAGRRLLERALAWAAKP